MRCPWRAEGDKMREEGAQEIAASLKRADPSLDSEKIEYWNCGKKIHLMKECRAPKKKGGRQQETTQEANVTGDVLQDDLILALDNTSDYWVVDSGASCHATPHRKLFYDYVQGDFGHV